MLNRRWRLHADRAPGRDRDHRGLDRPVAARRPGRARGGPPRPVHQQPEAARPGRSTTTSRPHTMLPLGRVWAPLPGIPFPSFFMGGPEHDLVHADASPVRAAGAVQRLQLLDRHRGTAPVPTACRSDHDQFDGLRDEARLPSSARATMTAHSTLSLADQWVRHRRHTRKLRRELGQHAVAPTKLRRRDRHAQSARDLYPIGIRSLLGQAGRDHRRDQLDGLHGRDAAGPTERRPGCRLDPGGGLREPIYSQQLPGFLRRRGPRDRRRRPAR